LSSIISPAAANHLLKSLKSTSVPIKSSARAVIDDVISSVALPTTGAVYTGADPRGPSDTEDISGVLKLGVDGGIGGAVAIVKLENELLKLANVSKLISGLGVVYIGALPDRVFVNVDVALCTSGAGVVKLGAPGDVGGTALIDKLANVPLKPANVS